MEPNQQGQIPADPPQQNTVPSQTIPPQPSTEPLSVVPAQPVTAVPQTSFPSQPLVEPPQAGLPNQPIIESPQTSLSSEPPQSFPEALSRNVGIIGIILAILAPPFGFVMSLINFLKARKNGTPDTLALVGIILSVGLFIIGSIVLFSIYSKTQNKLRGETYDIERRVDVNALVKHVERYVIAQQAFPESLEDIEQLPGIDKTELSAALVTPEGGSYTYRAIPEGCDKRTTCTGFKISSILSTGESFESGNSRQ